MRVIINGIEKFPSQNPLAKDEDINKAVQLGFCMASGRVFIAETVVPAEVGEQ